MTPSQMEGMGRCGMLASPAGASSGSPACTWVHQAVPAHTDACQPRQVWLVKDCSLLVLMHAAQTPLPVMLSPLPQSQHPLSSAFTRIYLSIRESFGSRIILGKCREEHSRVYLTASKSMYMCSIHCKGARHDQTSLPVFRVRLYLLLVLKIVGAPDFKAGSSRAAEHGERDAI